VGNVDWNAVAAIGQCLGAAATFAAVWIALGTERRARSTRLKVGVKKGGSAGAPDWLFRHIITVHVVNHSIRPVKLTYGGAHLPGGKSFLPFRFDESIGPVEEWGVAEMTISHEWIAERVREAGLTGPVKLWVYAQDATGRKHWCKHAFDPTPWIKDLEPLPNSPAAQVVRPGVSVSEVYSPSSHTRNGSGR
jgi:hypothetical protein